MKKIPSKSLLAGLVAVGVLPFAFGQASVTSTPVGYVKHTIPAGSSIVSAPFVNATEFQGEVSAVNGSSLTVAGSLPSLSGPAYVEVVDGAMAGLVLDIVSADGSTIEIDGSGVDSGDVIAVRHHTTLGTLLPGGEFGVFADVITLYRTDGAASFTWAGEDFGGWVDEEFESVSDTVIYPGEAVVVSVGNPVDVTFLGTVKVTPTMVVLSPGVPNLIGSVQPVSGLTLGASGIGESLDDFADSVTYYSTDGSLTSDAVFLTFGGMFIDDDFEDQSDVSFPSVNGLVFSVSSIKMVSIPGTVVSQN